MPNYDYHCSKCEKDFILFVKMSDSEKELTCQACDSILKKVYRTAPQVRTEKLSRTFLDKTSIGGGRPAGDGMEDLKKIAELQEKQLKVSHKSEEYKQITREINERKKL